MQMTTAALDRYLSGNQMTLKNGRSEWVGGGQIHCSILHPSSPAWWGGPGEGREGV